MKNYIKNVAPNAQGYLVIIYESEYSTLNWMDRRSTNIWASGKITELNAGYINGQMRFEVNIY